MKVKIKFTQREETVMEGGTFAKKIQIKPTVDSTRLDTKDEKVIRDYLIAAFGKSGLNKLAKRGHI